MAHAIIFSTAERPQQRGNGAPTPPPLADARATNTPGIAWAHLMPTESALIQRIRRALAKEGQRLKLSVAGDLGICVIDDRNNLVAWNCELPQLAKELGV